MVERINDNAYKLALPGEYNVSATFNVSGLSPFDDVSSDSRTNPLQEGEDDARCIGVGPVPVPKGDPWQIPQGPITRARAKAVQERLNGLVQMLLDEESVRQADHPCFQGEERLMNMKKEGSSKEMDFEEVEIQGTVQTQAELAPPGPTAPNGAKDQSMK